MSYFTSYCAEVQDYLKACEQLLAVAHKRELSEEELQMVESYALDVVNMHKVFPDPGEGRLSFPFLEQ